MTEPTRPDDAETRPSAASGFDFNRPTVVSLLYLGSFLTGISGLVGIVLAHVWAGEDGENWTRSHYTYLIRTFWIGLIASVLLAVTVIGLVLIWLPALWVGVRSVMSLIKAQERAPMPDPKTLLF
ncbi:DUF4870 family protein [Qipengyuania nanhaisediminis]|uniref:DUF4870 family protein n=1 Tax=Qipengyuania nanhaisediminis TaxID=604088 RepID=UPI0038B306DD